MGGGLGGPLRVSCYPVHSLFPSRTSHDAMGVLFLRQCRIPIVLAPYRTSSEVMGPPKVGEAETEEREEDASKTLDVVRWWELGSWNKDKEVAWWYLPLMEPMEQPPPPLVGLGALRPLCP